MTVEAVGQARDHVACAVAALRGAAASLREAQALLSEPVAALAPGELQTHAAVTDANANGIERIAQRLTQVASADT